MQYLPMREDDIDGDNMDKTETSHKGSLDSLIIRVFTKKSKHSLFLIMIMYIVPYLLHARKVEPQNQPL
jgi:hypothetical protein